MASRRVKRILKQVSETAANLMDLDSFYAALLDETTGQLAFPFAVSNSDELETGTGKWAPRPYKGQAVLPDYVMEIGHPVLAEPDVINWMVANKVAYWEDPVPLSWLGAPMMVGTKVLGVLVAENYGKARAFDSGARTVLSSIASRAATAIANARLYERLDRLNEVGQKLTSGIRLHQDEILELIYEQASQLMDTRGMYIALYDEKTDMVSFGLAVVDGRRVKVEKEESWKPRKAGKGATEEVIRTKKPLLLRTRKETEDWYAKHKEYIGLVPNAWLGVPMMIEDKVIGVIALTNDEADNIYGEDDLEVLQTMANQAAIAIENAVLYYDINQSLQATISELQKAKEALQDAQSQILAAERLAAASRVASEFAHRLNNIAGTIPVRIAQIKESISPSDPMYDVLLPHLDGISQDTRGLLKAAQDIKRTSEPRAPESLDVNMLLSTALTRVRSWVPTNIEVKDEYDPNIPPITAVGSQFVETLINLLTNAVQAMPNGGTLTICSKLGHHRGKRCIELLVADTGCGIPKEYLTKVFDLFFTTKPGGLGYGLWRDKNFIEGLGGEIDVESKVGKGSTFTIRVPVEVGK